MHNMSSWVSVCVSSPPSQIRIALKDWEQIQKFYQDSVNSQHYDAVYIIRKLIAENAVLYTAMPQMVRHSQIVILKYPLRYFVMLHTWQKGNLEIHLKSTYLPKLIKQCRSTKWQCSCLNSATCQSSDVYLHHWSKRDVNKIQLVETSMIHLTAAVWSMFIFLFYLYLS